MTQSLELLYHQHVLMSLRRQRLLAAELGQHTWDYQPQSGQIRFSSLPEAIPVQLLGSESEVSNTWQWAWAHDSSVPPEQLVAALQLRQWGAAHSIQEFTTAQLPRPELPAHLLGQVALGLYPARAYYRAAQEQSNLLFLLEDPGWKLPPLGASEFVTTLMEAFTQNQIPDHRLAVSHFLEQLGWQPQWQDLALEVQADDGVMVTGQFDSLHRLNKLSTRSRSGSHSN